MLTSQHVLDAHGARPGDTVYCPELSYEAATARIDPASLYPIAVITGDGHDGAHRFAYPHEPESDFHIDCATARLVDEQALPVGEVGFRVGRAHPLDALPHHALPVRLLGVHETHAGRITDTDATVERYDGTLCLRTIVIHSLPDRPPFATDGDSGALVVDRRDRAVGLLWGVDLTDPTIAYACHLQPVLDRLGLVPSSRVAIAAPGEDL
jgi:hypothetical protein